MPFGATKRGNMVNLKDKEDNENMIRVANRFISVVNEEKQRVEIGIVLNAIFNALLSIYRQLYFESDNRDEVREVVKDTHNHLDSDIDMMFNLMDLTTKSKGDEK